MDNITSEKINEAFSKLSPELNAAFLEMDTEKKINNLGSAFNLSQEEIYLIDSYVSFIFLGLADENSALDDFSKAFSDDNKKSFDVFSKIIKPICGELKNMAFSIKRKIDNSSVFNDLPENVQEAISLSGWKKSLFEIAEKNKFNIEQSGIFEDLTIKSMKNEVSSQEYRDQIKAQLSLEENKTSEIVAEVNEKIFQEIRNIMRESEDEKDGETESFSDINDVPTPPYAKKEPVVETKTDSNVQEKIIGVEHEKEGDTPSPIKNIEPEIGGVRDVDFSIPKPAVNTVKDVSDNNLAKPSKSHDPYREII